MTPAESMAIAEEAWGDEWFPAMHTMTEELCRFAALVAAKAAADERERLAATLVSIGDGYGVRDKGLDATTYSRMQQTAYEHAAVILTNGEQWSALAADELIALRARSPQ